MEGKMKAVMLRGPNEYGVEMVDIPKPGAGEVLVKIKSVAICGSDPDIFACEGYSVSLPFIPGHEFSGEIVEVGEGVVDYKIGDRVAGEGHRGCGYCFNCKGGLYNLCLNYGKTQTGHRHYGFTVNGAYAQYNAYKVNVITKIPDSLSFDEAALVDPAGTSYNAAMQTGVTPGGFSVTIGPGPIGIFAMQFAKALGSKTIMVGRGYRLDIAKKLGADYTINYEEVSDVVGRVWEITGIGADEAFECSGAQSSVDQAIRCCKKGGNISLVGMSKKNEATIPFRDFILGQMHLHGVRANPNVTRNVIELFAEGRVNAKDMITHRFPIDDIKTAVNTIVNRRDGAMKVIIHP